MASVRHVVRPLKLLLALSLCCLVFILSPLSSRLRQSAMQHQPGGYAIDHFVDGDTIAVRMSGNIEKIRLIGVDTPETHKPHTPVQCFGPDAAAYTKRLIGRQTVQLRADPLSSNRDRYGRLLRYVYLPDGTLLNRSLIEHGYGFYYPYFPFSQADAFSVAEQHAQSTDAGLWGQCQPTATDAGGFVSNPL